MGDSSTIRRPRPGCASAAASTPQPPASRRRLLMALAATTVMNLPLGTVYAFSVFLGPLEAELAVTRAELSFVFGFALVAFTAGMNLAPMLYRLAPAWMLVAGAAAVASLGIVLAASASGIGQLAVGYGVLFGLGGGAVYVLLLQGVNLMLDGRQGLVNGFIVSLYPAGAMIGAPLFGLALSHWGLRATLGGLATTLAVAGVVAAWLVVVSGLTVVAPVTRQAAAGERKVSIFLRLWIVFFLAAAAGLTVLGQAAGMVVAYGGSMALALFTTTAVTGCIAAARIGGGGSPTVSRHPW